MSTIDYAMHLALCQTCRTMVDLCILNGDPSSHARKRVAARLPMTDKTQRRIQTFYESCGYDTKQAFDEACDRIETATKEKTPTQSRVWVEKVLTVPEPVKEKPWADAVRRQAHQRSLTPEETPPSPFLCGRCHNKGHAVDQCMVNISVYCETCKRTGHTTRKCRSVK